MTIARGAAGAPTCDPSAAKRDIEHAQVRRRREHGLLERDRARNLDPRLEPEHEIGLILAGDGDVRQVPQRRRGRERGGGRSRARSGSRDERVLAGRDPRDRKLRRGHGRARQRDRARREHGVACVRLIGLARIQRDRRSRQRLTGVIDHRPGNGRRRHDLQREADVAVLLAGGHRHAGRRARAGDAGKVDGRVLHWPPTRGRRAAWRLRPARLRVGHRERRADANRRGGRARPRNRGDNVVAWRQPVDAVHAAIVCERARGRRRVRSRVDCQHGHAGGRTTVVVRDRSGDHRARQQFEHDRRALPVQQRDRHAGPAPGPLRSVERRDAADLAGRHGIARRRQRHELELALVTGADEARAHSSRTGETNRRMAHGLRRRTISDDRPGENRGAGRLVSQTDHRRAGARDRHK